MSLSATNDPGVIDRDGLAFAMMDGDKRVSCHVARDALAAGAGRDPAGERAAMAVFAAHRSSFEAILRRHHEAGRALRVTAADVAAAEDRP